MAHTLRSKRSLALFGLICVLSLAGCMPQAQLGGRPSQSTLDAVEAYLQRYQPGPEPRLFQSTRIYDRHGRLLADLWDEGRRTWVALDDISPHLIDATIATEDSTFYENYGVDPARVVGAMLQNYEGGGIVAGASTITMQLARNLFMSPDQRFNQTMDRKLSEAGLAQELNALFSKDEILEMYFNLLNYSHLAYGPEAAAQVYFGKHASELSLGEATLLAGIPQQPGELDLFYNFQQARERQRTVLELMVRHGFLTAAEAEAAYREPILLSPNPDTQPRLAPHFVQYVENTLDARLGDGALRRGGLTITTTLDLEMQTMAEELVAAKVAELRTKHDLTNAALVALRPGNGEVLAMVGSANFEDDEISGQVNVATSRRQPGSAIKPVLYATALDDNLISPATVLWDVPVTYTLAVNQSTGSAEKIYTPSNYDGKFRGPVTVRTALANSLNVPTVKLLDGVTVDRMIESANEMGILSLSPERDYGLSLTLGGGEVTLLELTGAFGVLANDGARVAPNPILAATDALGRSLDLASPNATSQVVSPAAAFQVTDILSDNAARKPMFGENSPLRLSRPAAAKTGTTTDFRDNWTVGYTRYLVSGVWAGNADGHPMKQTTGLTGAAPIWHDFMEAVIARPEFLVEIGAPTDAAVPADGWEFAPPPDVVQLPDCPPGLTCREGGEYFSRDWLDAAGDAGPLADSVEDVSSAPVYADSGDSSRWAAYCTVEPAATRTLIQLPDALGLPSNVEATDATSPDVKLEQQHVVAWTLRHPAAVNLGGCEELAAAAPAALALDREQGVNVARVVVDLSAAMDPNAGGVAGNLNEAPAQVASTGPISYYLAEPVTNHSSCPGNYIVGQVLNRQGGPVAGVRMIMLDQWGNRSDAVSKSGATDYGLFDFLLNPFANEYTLTVVDENGNPISAPVVVDHLQGAGGDSPCHTVILQGG